ncbi:MAG: type II toxin-antitoxin system VapC family toxin [Lapillicoccus sp.]
MILVDTSVWVDHLRVADRRLSQLLDGRQVLAHPWVLGEVLLGGLRAGSRVDHLMPRLPQAAVATSAEMVILIAHERLAGTGIGYVDVQLLASTMLTPNALLWTRDQHLNRVAERLGVAHVGR